MRALRFEGVILRIYHANHLHSLLEFAGGVGDLVDFVVEFEEIAGFL